MMNSIDKVIPEEMNQAKAEVVGIFDASNSKPSASTSLVGTLRPTEGTSSYLFPIFACSPNQISNENSIDDDRAIVIPPDGKFDNGLFTYSLLSSLESNIASGRELTVENVLGSATVMLQRLIDTGNRMAPNQYLQQNIIAGIKLETENDIHDKIIKRYRLMKLVNPG